MVLPTRRYAHSHTIEAYERLDRGCAVAPIYRDGWSSVDVSLVVGSIRPHTRGAYPPLFIIRDLFTIGLHL